MMDIRRRKFLRLAARAACIASIPRVARAQSYPARPVRLVVGYPAGLAPDILARIVARRLSDLLGQPFVVENRPGATGNIATETVTRAPADGYTLLLVAQPNATNATLYPHLPYDFIRDIAPIASIARGPLIMEVHPSMPADSVDAFIAYAKANPGKINMASGGNGSPQHVAGELFKMMAKVDMVHVPARNPLPDLLSGQVDVYFGPISSSIGYVRAGRLRALAVTGATRSPALPDVPTVGETVSGYEASSWYGVGAPRGTPGEIVATLNREINAALADPAIKAQLADLGSEPMPVTPAEFANFIAGETAKWGKVVKFASLRLD